MKEGRKHNVGKLADTVGIWKKSLIICQYFVMEDKAKDVSNRHHTEDRVVVIWSGFIILSGLLSFLQKHFLSSPI